MPRGAAVEASGAGLFEDAFARDVAHQYRELVEQGASARDAFRQVYSQFAHAIDDPQDGPLFWLAIAATQVESGKVDKKVRKRALEILDQAEALSRRAELRGLPAARKAELEALKSRLRP